MVIERKALLNVVSFFFIYGMCGEAEFTEFGLVIRIKLNFPVRVTTNFLSNTVMPYSRLTILQVKALSKKFASIKNFILLSTLN